MGGRLGVSTSATSSSATSSSGATASASGRLDAALLLTALLGAASAPAHVTRLARAQSELLGLLCRVASTVGGRGGALGGDALSGGASDTSGRLSVQAATAIVTNDQLRFDGVDASALLTIAAASSRQAEMTRSLLMTRDPPPLSCVCG